MTDELEYGFCYLLTNLVNGKRYVGQTIRPIEERMDQHHQCESRSSVKCAIARAIRKYKWCNFRVDILAEGIKTQAELDRIEIYYIKTLDTMTTGGKGYNMTEGGKGGRPTEEVRKRISEGNKGKKHTPEARARISAAKKGVPKSPEHRAKLSAANTGKKHSPEACAKMSAAAAGRRGKRHSLKTRAKISAGNKGRVKSPEECAKLSKAHKGKIISPEHREKLSAANREYYRTLRKHRAIKELRKLGWPVVT